MYEYGGDTGHGGRPSIDKTTLEALIVAAHARGKLAVVHIHSERQAMDAIEANADGLAHLLPRRRESRSTVCTAGGSSPRFRNPYVRRP
jgi:hypothetical protein